MKTNKSENVWVPVSGNDKVLQEKRNGKVTGRKAELVEPKLFSNSFERRMSEYDRYIKTHENTFIMYSSEDFMPYLYQIKNKK